MEWRIDDGGDFVTAIYRPYSSVKTVVKKPGGTTNDRVLDLLAREGLSEWSAATRERPPGAVALLPLGVLVAYPWGYGAMPRRAAKTRTRAAAPLPQHPVHFLSCHILQYVTGSVKGGRENLIFTLASGADVL